MSFSVPLRRDKCVDDQLDASRLIGSKPDSSHSIRDECSYSFIFDTNSPPDPWVTKIGTHLYLQFICLLGVFMTKVLEGKKPVTMDKVLRDISTGLDRAMGDATFNIKTVTVVLHVDIGVSGGVGIALPVIGNIGVKGKYKHLTETTIVFKPKPQPKERMKALRTEEEIPKSIQVIKDAIIAAQNITPDLQFESATTEIAFTLGEDGSLNFIFSANQEVNTAHKIIIQFVS